MSYTFLEELDLSFAGRQVVLPTTIGLFTNLTVLSMEGLRNFVSNSYFLFAPYVLTIGYFLSDRISCRSNSDRNLVPPKSTTAFPFF
jgi:hypothetical protein